MVYSSTLFLFLFLPLVLTIYFVLPKFTRNFFILVVSLIFYAWGELVLTWVMLFCLLINYASGLALARTWPWEKHTIAPLQPEERTSWHRRILVISLIGNLGILALFKYFNFGLDSVNSLITAIRGPGHELLPTVRFVLPLGISFYTFQAMSYTIDVYRGRVLATRNLINLAAYKTMFPQLVAGPIVRYCEIEKELKDRTTTLDDFALGACRFIVGLGKKVLIANVIAVPVDEIFALPSSELTFGLAWLGIVGYTIQIYFDFSGYSDMGIGIARILGFRFPENFDYPYSSQSVREFWRRWHMTLSFWFRDYLYIPMGGNKGSFWQVARNLVVVFFLCGLWHGAGWTFIVWGLYHGFFLCLERASQGRIHFQFPRPIAHTYVLLMVMVGWVFFRADTMGHALQFLAAMAGFGKGTGVGYSPAQLLTNEVVLVLIIGAIGSFPVLPALQASVNRAVARWNWMRHPAEALTLVALAVMFLISAMQLSSGTHNPFIYFRF